MYRPTSRRDKDAADRHESVATRPTIDPCRASVNHASIDIWTDCLSTLDRQVDHVSTTLDRYVGRVSIAGINRHSNAGAFSTHDPDHQIILDYVKK